MSVAFSNGKWQRSYHERIIRNERELNTACQCIRDNLARWVGDMENPNRENAAP